MYVSDADASSYLIPIRTRCTCFLLLLATIGSFYAPVVSAEGGRPAPESITQIELLELEDGGSATQGLALGKAHFFGSDNRGATGQIHRFDTQWKYIETKTYELPGVDHIGALSVYDDHLWTGFLNSKGPRKSLVVKINVSDLSVAESYNITADVTWIDPVCFDGVHVWVGDMSDMGIHRYAIKGDRLVRNGILRYPRDLHFSQGIRVRGNRLYSIHTFGDWDGLMEFDISDFNGEVMRAPKRFWPIPETRMHLEGFDFVPGRRGEVWHAQGKAVERFRLEGF